MAGFAVEDALLKGAGRELPAGQVMIWFGLGGMTLFAIAAFLKGENLIPASARQKTMLIRNGFELCGRLFYTLAIILAPLSAATAILQAAPIVVVAGAALIFGERVGWRRWCAIVLGLAGVMVILRPGAEDFTVYTIFAVLGMLGFAFRDLATRAAPPTMGTFTLGVYGFGTIVVAGLLTWSFQGGPFITPGPESSLLLGFACLFGFAGYTSLTFAMRTGEVSSVTPFRYTRLLFGIGLGIAVFGERPDLPTILGSLIVVASGLYILMRGRRV
mgnify:FL=1